MNSLEHATKAGTGTLESISEWVGAMEAASDTGEPVEFEGEEVDEDELMERAYEMPLSLQIRDGWRSPHEEGEPEEYELLMGTGGPAVRIVGKLGMFAEPITARLEVQDWGTPWTEHADSFRHADDLLRFAQTFYYGEG